MYTISLKSHVEAAPAKLLKIWRKPEILLNSAKSIKRLKVIRREKNRLLTLWEVEIDKVTLSWRQWDILSIKSGVIEFKMEDGEFNRCEGRWDILPDHDKKTALHLTVHMDWGIPTLEPYVKSSLMKKTRMIFRSFMASIKKTVEAR